MSVFHHDAVRHGRSSSGAAAHNEPRPRCEFVARVPSPPSIPPTPLMLISCLRNYDDQLVRGKFAMMFSYAVDGLSVFVPTIGSLVDCAVDVSGLFFANGSVRTSFFSTMSHYQ